MQVWGSQVHCKMSPEMDEAVVVWTGAGQASGQTARSLVSETSMSPGRKPPLKVGLRGLLSLASLACSQFQTGTQGTEAPVGSEKVPFCSGCWAQPGQSPALPEVRLVHGPRPPP